MAGKTQKNENGASVLEVLFVVLITGIILATATSMLFSTLSGSGKASGLAQVKQNGDFAIGYIERKIRSAESVDCSTGTALTIDDYQYSLINNGTIDRVGYDSVTAPGSPQYLTAEQMVAENFSCAVTAGTGSQPDVVEVSFVLTLAPSGKPAEKVSQAFETRVSLRNY